MISKRKRPLTEFMPRAPELPDACVLCTIDDAARVLAVSRMTIYRLKHQLEFVKIAGAPRITLRSLRRLVNDQLRCDVEREPEHG